jgi:hypothetical protein
MSAAVQYDNDAPPPPPPFYNPTMRPDAPSIPPLNIIDDLSLALQLDKQLPAPLPPNANSLNPPDQPFSPSTSGTSTPVSPSSPSPDPRPKRQNPLVDLIDTEKVYVDLLSGVIRVRPASFRPTNAHPRRL